MSIKSEAKLVVEIGRSRALAALVTFIHLGAGLCVFLFPAHLLIKLALTAALAVALARTLRLHAFRNDDGAIVELDLQAEKMQVRRRGSAEWQPCTCVSCFIHHYGVVLQLKAASRRFGVVILQDALGKSRFRELRARLKASARTADEVERPIKA